MQLPITISVSNELLALIPRLQSVSNKFAAQLNFHTMLANWYGDEDNILDINLQLLTREQLNVKVKQLDLAQEQVEKLSDDVLLITCHERLYEVYIAITDKELALLQQSSAILPEYLKTKLTKILNLIAKKKNFEFI